MKHLITVFSFVLLSFTLPALAGHDHDKDHHEGESKMITITKEDSKAAGLPEAHIEINLEGLDASTHHILSGGSYFTISGPPGNRESISIFPTTIDADNDALEDLAKDLWKDVNDLQIGSVGPVEIGSGTYLGVSGRAGKSDEHAFRDKLVIIIPTTEDGTEAVAVSFDKGADANSDKVPAPAQIVSNCNNAFVSAVQSVKVAF